MSTTEMHSDSGDAAVGNVGMHLEIDVIPVSDVDRAKKFYQRLGWRLDDDVAPFDGLRIVQFSVQGNHLHLIVEADSSTALSRGMQGLCIRLAKALKASPA